MTIRVLFVCSGNICRSPTAEAVLHQRIADRGLDIVADSAGFESYHVGDPPDPRAILRGRLRGYDLSGQQARQVVPADFDRFDHVIGMGHNHVAGLHRLAQRSRRDDAAGKIALFLDATDQYAGQDVPDPYYGDLRDFDRVLDLVELGIDALIARWVADRRP